MTTGVLDGVKNISIEDSQKARSRNLDVVAEFKKLKPKNTANFVVIGKVLLDFK